MFMNMLHISFCRVTLDSGVNSSGVQINMTWFRIGVYKPLEVHGGTARSL